MCVRESLGFCFYHRNATMARRMRIGKQETPAPLRQIIIFFLRLLKRSLLLPSTPTTLTLGIIRRNTSFRSPPPSLSSILSLSLSFQHFFFFCFVLCVKYSGFLLETQCIWHTAHTGTDQQLPLFSLASFRVCIVYCPWLIAKYRVFNDSKRFLTRCMHVIFTRHMLYVPFVKISYTP